MHRDKILQSNLLDILFDNRNKEYGAYVLRRDYDNRNWIPGRKSGEDVSVYFTIPVVSHTQIHPTSYTVHRTSYIFFILPIPQNHHLWL